MLLVRAMWLCLLFLAVMLTTSKASAQEPTFAERLGWPAGSRVVIFHVDDAGMSHDSNMGAIEAIEKGVATSTSLMMPCAWVPEFARYMKKHPGMDVGLHTTLTSEWENYRWGPVAGKAAVPGLVDEEGCLWNDVPLVVQHASADEVEKEIRAQVDRAEAMGIQLTHLDSHMGTVFEMKYFERYLKVGAEKHIPILVPGGHLQHTALEYPELVAVARELGKKTWELGLPVVDDIDGGGFEAKNYPNKKDQILDFLKTMKPGITQFIVHCTKPTDTFDKISGSGDTRLAELKAMTDPDVRKCAEENKTIFTTWRELKERRDKAK